MNAISFSLNSGWFALFLLSTVLWIVTLLHDSITTHNNTEHGKITYAVMQEVFHWKHQARHYEQMCRANGLLPVDPWNMPMPGLAPKSTPIARERPAVQPIQSSRPSMPSRPLHSSGWGRE